MPIYEYTCETCRKPFDHLARTMAAASPVACPACGSAKTSRALSLFAVGAESSSSKSPAPTGCGRCGGPNPCAMGD